MRPSVRTMLFGLVSWGLLAVAAGPASGSGMFTFSNANLIILNTTTTNFTLPNASPYPSSIVVSGLTTGLVVTKATVTLHGFTHRSPSDVALLLVGPQSQRALLMAEVGGQDARFSSVTNLTLVLDDSAANSLPIFTNLMSGTFKPTDGWLDPYFTDPSGALPYGFPPPAPPGSSNSVPALSVFKNSNPNGTWNLFALDDNSVYSGCISNGWSLSLSVAVPLQITRYQTNIVVSWPATITNCQLQSSPTLSGANIWSNSAIQPMPSVGYLNVTNAIQGGNVFYRLVTN